MGGNKSDRRVTLEVLFVEIQHLKLAMEGIGDVIKSLPCTDLSERIVKLEEFRITQDKLNAKTDNAIEGAFKKAREAEASVLELEREISDKNLNSKDASFNRLWKIGIVTYGAALALLQAMLLYFLGRS